MSDLISRQAALDIVFDFAEAPHNMYQKIRELPPAEPKKVVEDYCRPRNLMVVAAEDFHRFDVPDRTVGKWYDWSFTAFDGCTVWHRVCSVCGYKRDDDNLDKDTNYCPNCGARMERSEE